MESRLSRVQRFFLPLLLALLTQPVAAETLQERCARVKPIVDIKFEGRILRSTPDIQEPTLRRADALLSARCYDLYQQVVDEYVAKHPDDDRVWFLYARQSWIFSQEPKAKAMMARALAKRPGFTSMKVLQASMAIDENRLEDAQALLVQIEKEQSQDLWLFMHHLRLDALLTPGAETMRLLLAVIENPAFPGSARQVAFQVLQTMPSPSLDVLERAYRAQLTFESASPYSYKAHNLAFFLMHIGGKPEQAHAVLDSLLASPDYTDVWERARELKVDAYLLQAAQPKVDKAQRKALVEQAGKVVGNDWSRVESRLAAQPDQLGMLQEYLPRGSVAETVDEAGRTVLCDAVMTNSLYAVKAALRRGANPNGQCERTTLVQYMFNGWIYPDTDDLTASYVEILRALLAAGAAPPKDFSECTEKCKKHLVPVLREFPKGPRV
jgi:hypothetical protein